MLANHEPEGLPKTCCASFATSGIATSATHEPDFLPKTYWAVLPSAADVTLATSAMGEPDVLRKTCCFSVATGC